MDLGKYECTYNGRNDISYCKNWVAFKGLWRQNSIAWWPEQTKNMTYVELKKHCDDYFVCMDNTGCYKDFVNYQELDKCIDDVFHLGPMYYCETKLREIQKTTPEQLSECVKEHLDDSDPDKFDCLSIHEKGQCFLPDIEKHCEAKLLPMYKEHLSLRLYNRACDGRLRYKDWDYKNGQDYAIQLVPGGIQIADPKRNIINNTTFEENTDEITTNSTELNN